MQATRLQERDTPPPSDAGRSDVPSGSGQFVTFVCAGTDYGVPIGAVQEIKGWGPVTTIPRAPHFLVGVMNLRGTIVPVIDLRRVLGLDTQPVDSATAVLLVHAELSGGSLIAGLVVDAVSEVYDIEAGAIRDVPELGVAAEEVGLRGIVSIDGKNILLIDVDALIGIVAAATGDDGVTGGAETRAGQRRMSVGISTDQ